MMRSQLSRLALGSALLFAPSACFAANLLERAPLVAQMERVADWQLAHPSARPVDGWVQGAGYTGFMALAELSASPRFHDAMMKMGAANQWKPGSRVAHADDHCVAQTYLALYAQHRDPAMIGPIVARFDDLLAHPMDDNLEFSGPRKNDRWAWCDALYMAPPVWTRLAALTGKTAYLDYMVEHWWKTSGYLYDQEEHLYYRDSTYFAKREANGKKVFWSRGNGWVMGGLVRVLEHLPANHPARARFEQQFREMAKVLITAQQADGFWHASLLDPASFPAKEASGTGFFCYALAWGVNHGLLDRATYLPPVRQAWAALGTCVQPDGKLHHVQPIGADPKKFDETATEPYGVGAFLLAGCEMSRLQQ
ncbi:MAG: glycoside hydrolase family 88 protein [Opitutus sp.]|nr:glycoside hydrolase family 88 protein [Opitutus sp.]